MMSDRFSPRDRARVRAAVHKSSGMRTVRRGVALDGIAVRVMWFAFVPPFVERAVYFRR